MDTLIKYLLIVILSDSCLSGSVLTSPSLNFLIIVKMRAAIPILKGYTEDYMQQLFSNISLPQTLILYPSVSSPLPIRKVS